MCITHVMPASPRAFASIKIALGIGYRYAIVTIANMVQPKLDGSQCSALSEPVIAKEGS